MRLSPPRSSVLALVLVLAPALPLPSGWRAAAAVAALLVAWPLALWPRGPVPRPASTGTAEDLPLDLALAVRKLAWWPIAGAVPLLGLTTLGFAGVGMTFLLWLWLGGFVVCLVLGLTSRTRVTLPATPFRGAVRLGLLVALALVVGFVMRRGAPLGPMDDAYDHLATVRHLVSSERLEFPGAFYGRDVPRGADPRKGVLHVALALSARLAHVDAPAIWRAAPPVLALLAGLAYAGLALALFRRWGFVVFALLGLLVFSGDPGRLVRGAYGGHWGLVVAWAGMALALARGGFVAGLLAGLSAASVHAYSPAQLLVPLLGFAAANRLVGRPQPVGLFSFIGGALVGALPVDLARVLISAHSGNPLHEQAMPWLLFAAGPVASPLELLRAWGMPGAAAAVALLAVLTFQRRRIELFLLGAWVAPLALLLNPWLFKFVADRFGSVANKLLLCWDPALAVPGLLLVLVTGWSERRIPARIATGVALLILAVGILPTLPDRWASLLAPSAESLPAEIRDATRLAAARTPDSAVLASDPMTAYALPALSGRRAILTLQQHSPPGDDRALERLAVTAALFSTCVPLDSALAAAVGEGAGYLLVAGQPGSRIDQFGNHPDPRNESLLAQRFSTRPDLLHEIGRQGGATLYRIQDREAPPVGLPPETLAASSPPAGRPAAGGGGLRVVEGGIQLEALTPPPGPWARGSIVRLPVLWTRLRGGAQYEEYTAHIRFENSAMPVMRGWMGAFSKPFRRIYLERKAGGAYRSRAVESPFRGLCPPADWEIGRAMADTLQFQVPSALLPGGYRLRVALERGTLYPVLKPADLLRDEDRFSGPVLGTLEIQ